MGVLLDALVRMELYHWGATISVVNMGEYPTAVQPVVVLTRLDTGLLGNTPDNPNERCV